MDLEHAEREDELGLGATPEPAVTWSWGSWDARNLPVEPEGGTPAGDETRRLQNLRAFHLYGRRPADAHGPAGDGAMPALLHRYRDLSRVRHEFPVCIHADDFRVLTLTEWTDQWLAANAPDGDAGEQLKRNVYRLESVVRALCAESEGESLSVLWDRAAATILETSNAPEASETLLREHIALLRGAGAGGVTVLGFGPQAVLRLLRVSAGAHWLDRCAEWSGELDAIVRRLQDILSADFDHSEAARSPAHLRESLGTDGEDVDVDAMSSLLARAPRDSGLPAGRRARIEALLATLTRMQPVFDARGDARDRAPIQYDAVFEDCSTALREEQDRSACMAEFFRAVRIARLEAQNRYRPDVHDPFFEGFDARHLTEDERSLCPPVLLHLTDESCSHVESGVLLGILNGTARIKVLVELRTLYRTDGRVECPALSFTGASRLAAMAAALNRAYVLQAPLSSVTLLRKGLLDGLRYQGPALVCVHAPAVDHAPDTAFLRAAAATESRVFPLIAFDPARGDVLADRMDVSGNPQPDAAWTSSAFTFRRATGEDASAEIAFTPGDYFHLDRTLAGLFWPIDSERWHDSLIPLHEYLELSGEKAAGRIPYLLTVDREGHIGHAVVARPVVDAALQCRAFWRAVQESGGIQNSFATRALDSERATLTKEKEREIEAIEKNYLAQLDQDVGELTREIVQRIAGQLLGAESISYSASAGALSAAPTPAGTASAPAPTPVAAAETVEPAEEAVSFDDPYIDTPLCTSCNECTQLNNRLFTYNGNKQAEIKDAGAGPFSDLVRAAELCPVHIIHPGKPKNPGEPGLADWVARAAKFN